MIKEKYIKNIEIENLEKTNTEKLSNARVLIAGSGSLGAKVIANLASVGIGTIGIIDDTNDTKNKNINFAKNWIETNYKNINVKTYNTGLDNINTKEIVKEYDIIADCLDNYKSKFLLNDFAVINNIPLVHGEAAKHYGHITTIIPHKTPCLKCLFPNTNKDIKLAETTSCFAVNAIGALISQSIINVLLNIQDDFENTLLTYNSEEMELKKIKLSANPNCKICGQNHQ